MEGEGRRGSRLGPRWTLGSLMIAIAGVGLACALLKPFTESPPSSGEIIGVDFDFQETRLPDGRVVSGVVQKVIVTKQDGAGSQVRQP